MKIKCSVFKQCGGCRKPEFPYQESLKKKQMDVEKLLKKYCRINPIIGMKEPYYYRSKTHLLFGHQREKIIYGVYRQGTLQVVPIENCQLEDQQVQAIFATIGKLLPGFKIKTYDEKSSYGFLRHVLVRRGVVSGEVMVVLVTSSPVFPAKNNFVKALRKEHPEITTVIQNVNNRGTGLAMGDKENVLYGKGYIVDQLGGLTFKIATKTLYPVNAVQAEVLYQKVIAAAGLTGQETVLDGYCEMGIAGMFASKAAKQVIGVEQNKNAVRDAIDAAKRNQLGNVQFYQNDPGNFIQQVAKRGDKVDVVLMNPPRNGSTKEFMDGIVAVRADRVVYRSHDLVTLEKDLQYLKKLGYQPREAWLVDVLPWTGHVETVVLLEKKTQ